MNFFDIGTRLQTGSISEREAIEAGGNFMSAVALQSPTMLGACLAQGLEQLNDDHEVIRFIVTKMTLLKALVTVYPASPSASDWEVLEVAFREFRGLIAYAFYEGRGARWADLVAENLIEGIVDALVRADSLTVDSAGAMSPWGIDSYEFRTTQVIKWLREGWKAAQA